MMKYDRVTYVATNIDDVEALRKFRELCKSKRVSMSNIIRQTIRAFISRNLEIESANKK